MQNISKVSRINVLLICYRSGGFKEAPTINIAQHGKVDMLKAARSTVAGDVEQNRYAIVYEHLLIFEMVTSKIM
jgi:hypothetical protein